MSRRRWAKSERVVPSNPDPHCAACKGTGWVEAVAAPALTSVDGRRVEYDKPVMRCSCTLTQLERETPTPSPVDRARRAAGETD